MSALGLGRHKVQRDWRDLSACPSCPLAFSVHRTKRRLFRQLTHLWKIFDNSWKSSAQRSMASGCSSSLAVRLSRQRVSWFVAPQHRQLLFVLSAGHWPRNFIGPRISDYGRHHPNCCGRAHDSERACSWINCANPHVPEFVASIRNRRTVAVAPRSGAASLEH